MIDLREYKGIAKAAVAKERELDENWGWSLKAVNKNEIRIGWGYLDYIGEKDPFKVELFQEDGDVYMIGTIPNGDRVFANIGPTRWDNYDTIEKAIAGVIHSMACSAHRTY